MSITIAHYPLVKHCKRCSGMGFSRTKKGSWKLCPICKGYGVDREWVHAIVAWLEGRMTDKDREILDKIPRPEVGAPSEIFPDHLDKKPAEWSAK